MVTQDILEVIEGKGFDAPLVEVGTGDLPSIFAVSDFASATIAAAGRAATRLFGGGDVVIDRRLASFWFGMTIRPQGWDLPPLWDPIAGDYATNDGWIRLHTNAPHHRAAALSVLGPLETRQKVAAALETWSKADLETAVVEAGGCAAQMMSQAEWAAHPQGQAVQSEPLIAIETGTSGTGWTARGNSLSGLKVLDLTRVLAGPVATRFLAGLGAEVLRIDPLDWEEGAVIPEVALGKRCARLDLKTKEGRNTLKSLIADADVMIHGYRPKALAHLGFSSRELQELRPGLVEVTHSAYGWSGPWATRRGFDSLVQMSSGIAHQGMTDHRAEKPVPLPVQALDHGCGYLVAMAALNGLRRRMRDGVGSTSRLSLARVGDLLACSAVSAQTPFGPETGADLSDVVEDTSWGPARRVASPLTIGGQPLRWAHPAGALGRHRAIWSQ